MNEFDDDAVSRIVRRAVELDTGRGDAAGVDRESLVAAATEVGIDRSAIELAIAENQMRPVPQRRALDRVVGPRQAVAARRIDAAHDPVYIAVGEWLTRAQFRPLYRNQHVTVWDRRSDFTASARRLLSIVVGGVRLGEATRIEVQVVPIDGRATLVQIIGENPSRRVAAAASSASLATLGAASLVAGLWVPPVALFAIPSVIGAAAISFASKRQAKRAATEFDRLLDQLAANERPSFLGTPKRATAWRRPSRPHISRERPTA